MNTFAPLRNTAATLLLLLAIQTNAQTAANPTSGSKATNYPKEEQSLFAKPDFSANDGVTLDGMKLRNEQMFRHFTSHFSNASDIAIYPHDRATVVYCMADGIRNNILYSSKGKLIHTVRYYDASKLPGHVAELVESAFPKYQLKQVSEITTDGKTAFLVNIESARNFKTIRVLDDDWNIYQEFDKTN